MTALAAERAEFELGDIEPGTVSTGLTSRPACLNHQVTDVVYTKRVAGGRGSDEPKAG
jgi:hypothetical protein